MREFRITHKIIQTVEANTLEEARKTAGDALLLVQGEDTLWDPVIALMHVNEVEDDEAETCASEDCDNSLDDGEGSDGYCGDCADVRERERITRLVEQFGAFLNGSSPWGDLSTTIYLTIGTLAQEDMLERWLAIEENNPDTTGDDRDQILDYIEEHGFSKPEPEYVPVRIDELKSGDVLKSGATVLRIEQDSKHPTNLDLNMLTVFTDAGRPGTGAVSQVQYVAMEVLSKRVDKTESDD